MASTVEYNGNGVQVDFTITYEYLDRDFIQVYVDDVLQTITTHYSFQSDTVVRFVTAPPSGTNNVELRRVTSTTPVVDFTNGAGVFEDDLDKVAQQALHLTEEAIRDNIDNLSKTGANWDGEGLRITNVADPTAAQDVATNNSIAAQVTAAETAETNAGLSATAASASAVTAVASASAASAAQTGAETAETGAEAAKTAIEAAFDLTSLTEYAIPMADAGGTSYTSFSNLAWLRSASGTFASVANGTVSIPSNTDFNSIHPEEHRSCHGRG